MNNVSSLVASDIKVISQIHKTVTLKPECKSDLKKPVGDSIVTSQVSEITVNYFSIKIMSHKGQYRVR